MRKSDRDALYSDYMKEPRVIGKGDVIYAKVFHADIACPDVLGVTEDSDPLQVILFSRDAGYEVKAHRHLPRKIDLAHVGEFLWIQEGKVTATVFDEEWNVLGEITAEGGDCIVFMRGGHELKMLEKTRILEVKQGPYPGKEKDKVFRNPK